MIYNQKRKNKYFFWIFFSGVRTVKIFFFLIFSKFSPFFWKMSQGVLGNFKRNKVMKYELIWSVLRGVTHNHLHVRADCTTPPCSIGLNVEMLKSYNVWYLDAAMLNCWNGEIPKCWNTDMCEVLECLNTNMPEC